MSNISRRLAPFSGIPTHEQQVALALVPKFTAGLSIVGSTYIVYDVLRNKGGDNSPNTEKKAGRKRSLRQSGRSTYYRLMVGMSACDISMSSGVFLSTWPMPKEVPNVWGNVGTIRTCTAQGFFEQFGVSTVMYSASLSIYYLITIRSGRFASRSVMKNMEPWLHLIPLAFGFATAIAGLILRLFNYGLWDCWIAPMPQGCEESWRSDNGETTCIRGDNASLYQWLFDLIPKWTSILIVTVNMILVFCHVRNQERAAERWSSRRHSSSRNSSTRKSTGSRRSSDGSDNDGEAFSPNSANSSPTSPSDGLPPSRSPSVQSESMQQRSRSSRKISASKQIAHQSYLYVGALWITWLAPIVTRASQLATGSTYYWMIMMVAVTIPLQGWWNALVYLRPRWIRLRKEQREERERERERERHEGENGVDVEEIDSAGTVNNFLRDISVAAVECVRQGDISEGDEDERQRDRAAQIERFELEEKTNVADEVAFDGDNAGERKSTVSFSSKLASNAEEEVQWEENT